MHQLCTPDQAVCLPACKSCKERRLSVFLLRLCLPRDVAVFQGAGRAWRAVALAGVGCRLRSPGHLLSLNGRALPGAGLENPTVDSPSPWPVEKPPVGHAESVWPPWACGGPAECQVVTLGRREPCEPCGSSWQDNVSWPLVGARPGRWRGLWPEDPRPACQAGAKTCVCLASHPPPPLCSLHMPPPTGSVALSTDTRGSAGACGNGEPAALPNQGLLPSPRAGPTGKETDAQAGAGQSEESQRVSVLQLIPPAPPAQPRED